MNPYLLTISFLTLMSLITSSEVSRFAESSAEAHLYQSYLANTAETEEARGRALMGDCRGIRGEKTAPTFPFEKSGFSIPPVSLHFDTERPPNNSRINLRFLLHEKLPPSLPQGFSFYECTAQVMRLLYGEEPFFRALPHAEYQILDALIEQKEKTTNFEYPDELSSICFDNPRLQKIFYQMLKGTSTAPSLLNYLTFDKGREYKINLMFASPIIIEAIFPNSNIAEQILAVREHLWKEIIDQEENRLERIKDESKSRRIFKTELREALESFLRSATLDVGAYKRIFDLSLGQKLKPGNVLFIFNSETGEIKREKHPKKPLTHSKKY